MDTQSPWFLSERARRSALPGLLLAVVAAAAGCAGMQATMTPIQVSVAPGAQAFTQDMPVRGMVLNLVAGAQDDVVGLDIGLLNAVDKEFTGVGAGLVNNGHGNVRALQVGLGNTADVSFTGLQASIVNQADGEMRGAQVGLGNFAGKCLGVQLGVVNKVDSTLRGNPGVELVAALEAIDGDHAVLSQASNYYGKDDDRDIGCGYG